MLVLVTIAAAFGVGVWVGRQKASQRQKEGITGAGNETEMMLGAGRTARTRSQTKTTKQEETKTLSLEEIKTGIAGLAKLRVSEREQAVEQLANGVRVPDLPEVFALTEEISPEELRMMLRNALLKHWAETNPELAIEQAMKVSPAYSRQEAVVAVVGAWADQDATSAAAWLKQMPADSLRNRAIEAVIPQLGEKDPEQAVGLLASFGYSPEWTGTISSIFSSWARSDVKAAAAKALSSPSPCRWHCAVSSPE
jgi:hypothetical protein